MNVNELQRTNFAPMASQEVLYCKMTFLGCSCEKMALCCESSNRGSCADKLKSKGKRGLTTIKIMEICGLI